MKTKDAYAKAKELLGTNEGVVTYVNEGIKIDFVDAPKRGAEIRGIAVRLRSQFGNVNVVGRKWLSIVITL